MSKICPNCRKENDNVISICMGSISADISGKNNELLKKYVDEYNGVYCIECFHPLALLWYKKHRPDVIRGQLCMEYWKDEQYKGKVLYLLLSYLVTNVATRPDFIAYRYLDAKNLSRRLCRAMGALSVTWTIKSRKDYQDVAKEFDLFIFDNCRL